jgi:hypothetical protein
MTEVVHYAIPLITFCMSSFINQIPDKRERKSMRQSNGMKRSRRKITENAE